MFAHINQAIEHDFIPVIKLRLIGNLLLYKIDLFARIVDQCRQLFYIFFRQRTPVYFTDLLFDCAGSVPQYVGKRLVLSVDIRDKMLCTLGQIQY